MKSLPIRTSILLVLLMFLTTTGFSAEPTKTVIDEWSSITAPPPPELKVITVNPQTTALLILDIQTRMVEQRPRCAESVPKIKDMLDRARAKNMLVAYSLTSAAVPADIAAAVAPLPNELIVKSSVDKFYNTDLDFTLKARDIKTVIIVGTVAHGAVLNTATGASVRGYQVIVPVDGMSADTLYPEQYTAWHLMNSPGTRNRTMLTKIDMITIE
ncbi:cysteine hydrolase family protein [Anaerosporomusa subterranea]|nr:isochorismatase family protein [Anaerosporomusa subterranea]